MATTIAVASLVVGTKRPIRRWFDSQNSRWVVEDVTEQEYFAGLSKLPKSLLFNGTDEEWLALVQAQLVRGEIRELFNTVDGEPSAGHVVDLGDGRIMIYRGGDRTNGGLLLQPGDYIGKLPNITAVKALPAGWVVLNGEVTIPVVAAVIL